MCSGQATRVWQQASTVTGDTLETVTGCQLYTIIRISLSHSILLSPLFIYLHIHQFIPSPPSVFTPFRLYLSFCFSFSTALQFLSGSQWDLNNWTLLTIFFCLFLSVNGEMFLSLPFLLLFQLHSVFYAVAVTSGAPCLTHMVFVTWLSRHWSLNPIFSLLLFWSLHPAIQRPLEPPREGIISVWREQRRT